MPDVAPGIHLSLPGEIESPYQWGGEGDHGETNPIRNYIAACQDAAEGAIERPEHYDGGVPSKQYWQNQVEEAQRIVDAFDDIGEDGMPTVVPGELVELQKKLKVERPDFQDNTLFIDRNGITADADEFNIGLGAYADTMRVANGEVTPYVEVIKWEVSSFDGEMREASGYSTDYVRTEPYGRGTSPWKDWQQAEEFVMDTARDLPGQWHGGRLAGVPEHGAVVVSQDGQVEHPRHTGRTVEMSTLLDRDAEPVELAGDVTMWIQPEQHASARNVPVNKTATNVAAEFGVNHYRYNGPAVFTGAIADDGNVRALDREQIAAVEEVADYYAIEAHQRNPRWPSVRGAELLDTFDTRAKHGLPTTLQQHQEERTQQQVALDQVAQQSPSAAGPGLN